MPQAIGAHQQLVLGVALPGKIIHEMSAVLGLSGWSHLA